MTISDEENPNEHDESQNSLPQSRKRTLIGALGNISKKNKTTPLDPFIKVARWIGRSQDPFTNFYSIIYTTLNEDEESHSSDSEVESASREDEARRKELVRLFKLVSSAIPGFNVRMDEFMESPEDLNKLCFRMTNALSGARADDCASLREAGLVYTAYEVGQDFLTPHITFKAPKDTSRGFNHPQLGRLLCPAKHLADFDANSTEFLQKLQDGRVLASSSDLPIFLYSNFKYDPTEMDSGLCRSELLVRTWRHIFTSPSSAIKNTPGPGRTKSGQAKLNSLECVTARTIAYAALHVYWFLCDKDDWRLGDELFNKEEFFHIIVRLFEIDPDDIWVKDTLQWWDSRVFSAKISVITSTSSTSDLSIIFAQRRARRSQQALSSNTGTTPEGLLTPSRRLSASHTTSSASASGRPGPSLTSAPGRPGPGGPSPTLERAPTSAHHSPAQSRSPSPEKTPSPPPTPAQPHSPVHSQTRAPRSPAPTRPRPRRVSQRRKH